MVLQLSGPAEPAYDLFVYDVYSLMEDADGPPVRHDSAAAFRPLIDSADWDAAVGALAGRRTGGGGHSARIVRYVVRDAAMGPRRPRQCVSGTEVSLPGARGFVLTVKVVRHRAESAPPAYVRVTPGAAHTGRR